MISQRPLFWHQGLFLQPQHFQLLDRHHGWLVQSMGALLSPYFWGVAELVIQEKALGNRSFDLLKGEFLFPDGTYAAVPGNAVIEARSFEADWVEGERPLDVFVGLKKWMEGEENVTVLESPESLSGVSTRYAAFAEAEEVADLHHKGPPAQVKPLHHVLKIFWDRERDGAGDYQMIPVARLVRSGDEILLSDRFAPPCLHLAADETLLRITREVRDLVASRGAQLELMKTQRGVQTAEFGSRDMVYLLALRSLNRYVPLLYHLSEAPRVHPWEVYGVLRQIVGELSSFSERYSVLGEPASGKGGLPRYDHEHPWPCFSEAQKLITILLDEITAGPEYILPLLFDGTYFAAQLPPVIFEGRNRFYLVMKTEEDPKVVLQSLATVAKLSSREHLPILIARALPGIGLEHLPVPPQELPRRASCLYFQIDHHGEPWGFVQKGRNIALYWDAAPDDLDVELMVVGRG